MNEKDAIEVVLDEALFATTFGRVLAQETAARKDDIRQLREAVRLLSKTNPLPYSVALAALAQIIGLSIGKAIEQAEEKGQRTSNEEITLMVAGIGEYIEQTIYAGIKAQAGTPS